MLLPRYRRLKDGFPSFSPPETPKVGLPLADSPGPQSAGSTGEGDGEGGDNVSEQACISSRAWDLSYQVTFVFVSVLLLPKLTKIILAIALINSYFSSFLSARRCNAWTIKAQNNLTARSFYNGNGGCAESAAC